MVIFFKFPFLNACSQGLKMESIEKKRSLKWSRSLQLKIGPVNQQLPPELGACSRCRIFGPSHTYWTRIYILNKIPVCLIRTIKSEKLWGGTKVCPKPCRQFANDGAELRNACFRSSGGYLPDTPKNQPKVSTRRRLECFPTKESQTINGSWDQRVNLNQQWWGCGG